MKTKSMRIINNEIYIGKYRASDLAKTYKTPLYVYDEEGIIDKVETFKKKFVSSKFECEIVYASKAFLAPRICDILKRYDFGIDAVSGGDLFLINKSHFPMQKVVLHGNNKSNEELLMAIDLGVGYIVVDSLNELIRLEKLVKNTDNKVKTLVRVNPGIEAHTHAYIETSLLNSKFGESIYDKEVFLKMAEIYKNSKNLLFEGFHSHIGSQINQPDSFLAQGKTMGKFVIDFYKATNMKVKVLNMGGGFAIKYLDEDAEINLEDMFKKMVTNLENIFEDNIVGLEKIMIEPGRSLIGDSGVTLYTASSGKTTYGGKKYVFIDGGMPDNIRPALYQAKYSVDIANRYDGGKKELRDVVGKCCESGDIIATDIMLGEVKENDTIIVYSTGAYCYSMSMNYNGLTRGAVVFVNGDECHVAIRKQEFEDLVNTCVFKEENMKIFDTHSDMLYDLYKRSLKGDNTRFTDFHVPQLKNSLVRGAVWAMYSPDDFDLLEAVKIALSKIDLSNFKEFNVLLGLEGLRNLKKWEDIEELYNLGFRHAMLTWNEDNKYATGVAGDKDSGLKEDGKKLLSKMMELKMIIDLAHLNEKSFYDVLDYVKDYDKLIYSHGCCKAITDHRRNMTDDQMKALKKVNGIFGLTLARNFVSKNKDEQDVTHFLNHVDRAIEFMGEDNVCFGFDFMDYLSEYGNDNIEDVANATLTYRIVEGMRNRGYSEERIEKICWKNFYNKYQDLLFIKGE